MVNDDFDNSYDDLIKKKEWYERERKKQEYFKKKLKELVENNKGDNK